MPLAFWGPGRVLAGERRDVLVTHLDIAPTILGLAGVDATAPLKHAEGRSLEALLDAPSEVLTAIAAVAERRSYDEEPGHKWALQDDRYSFMHATELNDELFDVISDPYRTSNLARGMPDVARRYRARLDRIIARLATSAHESGFVDEETLRRLRSLGYIQ